jgi:YD repeat-containing protein
MALHKRYIRDGQNKIIGSVTSGFADDTMEVARDEHGNLLGRTSTTFGTTRDQNGALVSLNTSDSGLLFNRKK